ncbi:hypothetical protein WN55_11071 [Dufourea novaeangliae]|uniref:Uncharacterized protein n=1 Tax=Dufourea novaeangliae TaxID=178035 RepID=A0A154PBX2_DUFNO|nr:hypothetical protein WN55_11071 [Dufourea novaeangliae]
MEEKRNKRQHGNHGDNYAWSYTIGTVWARRQDFEIVEMKGEKKLAAPRFLMRRIALRNVLKSLTSSTCR